MKKSITIVILLTMILIGVIPAGFGFWAEARMNRMMEEMLDSEALDFTIIKQDRGWLNSTYDIAVEPGGEVLEAYREYQMRANQQSNQQGDADNEGQIVSILIRNVVHHGPFPVDEYRKGRISFVPVIATIDTEVIGISGIENTGDVSEFPISYSIHSLVSLTEKTLSVINIEAWSGIPEGGKAKVDWLGLNAELSYDMVRGGLKGKIRMPAFSSIKQDEKFQLSDIQIDIDLDVNEHFQYLMLGKIDFHIGTVHLDNLSNDRQKFSMEDCTFTIVSDISNGNISSTMEMSIKSIQSGDRNYGPGKYILKLSNLDAESLNKMDQQVKELKIQGMPQEQISMMLAANMFSILPDFLAKGPKLEISRLSLESDYGLLEGSGQLYFDTTNVAALKNPMLLKEAIIAELEFSIPEELLVLLATNKVKQEIAESGIVYSEEQMETNTRTQITNQMDFLVAQNIFIRNNKNYSINASFKKGQLTVNGGIVDFPQMQQ